MKINIYFYSRSKRDFFAVIGVFNLRSVKVESLGIKPVPCRRIRLTVRIYAKSRQNVFTVAVNRNSDNIFFNKIKPCVYIIASIKSVIIGVIHQLKIMIKFH